MRYLAGTLKTRDIDVQESILRDLGVWVLDKLSRVCLLWNLIDDSSHLGKSILGKLSLVTDYYTQGRGSPFCSLRTGDEEEMAFTLWQVVRTSLELMVVTRMERCR